MVRLTGMDPIKPTCGCGGAPATTELPPTAAPAPAHALEMVYEMPFSARCSNGSCIPWVRAGRDPEEFRALYDHMKKVGPIKDSDRLYDYLKDFMAAQVQEVFLVILFNTQLQVLDVSEVTRGAVDRVQVPMPDVLRLPIHRSATTFAVAHNHPSGNPKPSQADKELTKAIAKAGSTVGIELIDHLVFGARDYYSFAEHEMKRKKKGK
jgi:hypothetical protein